MLIYPGVINTATTATVDGYSNRKSKTAAIKEMGRYIRKYINKEEGQSIIDYPEECPTISPSEYFLITEEVPCASYFDEKTDGQIGYTDANWYIVCRIVK